MIKNFFKKLFQVIAGTIMLLYFLAIILISIVAVILFIIPAIIIYNLSTEDERDAFRDKLGNIG